MKIALKQIISALASVAEARAEIANLESLADRQSHCSNYTAADATHAEIVVANAMLQNFIDSTTIEVTQ